MDVHLARSCVLFLLVTTYTPSIDGKNCKHGVGHPSYDPSCDETTAAPTMTAVTPPPATTVTTTPIPTTVTTTPPPPPPTTTTSTTTTSPPPTTTSTTTTPPPAATTTTQPLTTTTTTQSPTTTTTSQPPTTTTTAQPPTTTTTTQPPTTTTTTQPTLQSLNMTEASSTSTINPTSSTTTASDTSSTTDPITETPTNTPIVTTLDILSTTIPSSETTATTYKMHSTTQQTQSSNSSTTGQTATVFRTTSLAPTYTHSRETGTTTSQTESTSASTAYPKPASTTSVLPTTQPSPPPTSSQLTQTTTLPLEDLRVNAMEILNASTDTNNETMRISDAVTTHLNTRRLTVEDLLEVSEILNFVADPDKLSTYSMEDIVMSLDLVYQASGEFNSSSASVTVAGGILNVVDNVLTSLHVGSTSNIDERRDLLDGTETFLNKMSSSLASTLITDDPAVVIDSDVVCIGMARQSADGSSIPIQSRYAGVKVDEGGTSESDLSIQMRSYRHSPFIHAANSDTVNTPVLNVKAYSSGALAQGVKFTATSKVSVSLEAQTQDSINASGIISSYQVLEKNAYLKVFLDIPDDGQDYQMYTDVNSRPTNESYKLHVEITSDEMSVITNTDDAHLTYQKGRGKLRLFVFLREYPAYSTYYVKLQPVVSTSESSARRRREVSSEGQGFQSTAAVYTPKVWDEESESWVYSDQLEFSNIYVEATQEIYVDPESDEEEIVFKSNFMGSMTSGLFIPPNKIEFDEVFDDMAGKTAENPYVLIVVCCLIGLYLLLLLPMRRADFRDYKEWHYEPIVQNHPDDTGVYLISLSLNKKSFSSFKANVFCVIYGEKGKTAPLHLYTGTKRKVFQPSKYSNFMISTAENIGVVTHLHIWTDAVKHEDSMLVDSAMIYDTTSRKTFGFKLSTWLSPTIETGYIHEIFPVDVEGNSDFARLLKNNSKDMMFDDHIWLSLIKRPKRSGFSRVQRLSLCLATLFLIMIVNAMWYETDKEAEETTSSIKIGPISISWNTVFVSAMGSLIVMPPLFIITFIFKKARPYIPESKRKGKFHVSSNVSSRQASVDLSDSVRQTMMQVKPAEPSYNPNVLHHLSDWEQTNEKSERQPSMALEDGLMINKAPLRLPWWFTIFAYMLVAASIINGGFWCYLYSLQWGKEISLEWLASFVLSFLESLFLLQPARVLALAVIMSLFLQNTDDDLDDYSKINHVSEFYGEVKPLKSNETLVVPQKVQRSDPVLIKRESSLKNKLLTKFKGIATHLLCLILLLLIVSHNTSSNYYRQNKAIKETFNGNIKTSAISALWPWLQTSIIPNVYPSRAYNGDILDYYNQQFIYNIDGLLLGPVRVKQNRDSIGDCDYVERFTRPVLARVQCQSKVEERDWTAKWETLLSANNINSTHDPYLFQKVEGLKYGGYVSSYVPSGYSVSLQRYNYADLLSLLEREEWIDRRTRSLFIEFVINNMNTQTFSQVKILVELPSGGGLIKSVDVNTFRPYPYIDQFDFIFLCFQCIWGLLLIYIAVRQVLDLKNQGVSLYFSDPWHTIEIINLLFSLLSVLFLALRTVEVIDKVEFLKNNRGEYVDFDTVALWDEMYSMCLAVVMFITILQLYQPMDFSVQLNAMKMVLKNTGGVVKWYIALFIVFFFIFAHTLYLMIGAVSESFCSLWSSYYSTLVTVIGMYGYNDIVGAYSDIWLLKLLYSFLMSAGSFFILNMFISVINTAATFIRENPEEQEYDKDLGDFITDKLSIWWKSMSGKNRRNEDMYSLNRDRRGGRWCPEIDKYNSLLDDVMNGKDFGTKLQQKIDSLLNLGNYPHKSKTYKVPDCSEPRSQKSGGSNRQSMM